MKKESERKENLRISERKTQKVANGSRKELK